MCNQANRKEDGFAGKVVGASSPRRKRFLSILISVTYFKWELSRWHALADARILQRHSQYGPNREASISDTGILELLAKAKILAQQYRALTGKPLGITGEVAEYEAAQHLGVELTPARQAGYDAIEIVDGIRRTLQIKGRCLLQNCKPGQRLGSIDVRKEFDAVLLVLLDENFNATAIYEADRQAVLAALAAPGSISRNERGALAVSKFKAIGRLRWKHSDGLA
jgi:hypothetical protein